MVGTTLGPMFVYSTSLFVDLYISIQLNPTSFATFLLQTVYQLKKRNSIPKTKFKLGRLNCNNNLHAVLVIFTKQYSKLLTLCGIGWHMDRGGPIPWKTRIVVENEQSLTHKLRPKRFIYTTIFILDLLVKIWRT